MRSRVFGWLSGGACALFAWGLLAPAPVRGQDAPLPVPAPTPSPGPRPGGPKPASQAVPDPAEAGTPAAWTMDFETLPGGAALPEGLLPQTGTWTVVADPEEKTRHVLQQEATVETFGVVILTGKGKAMTDGKVSVRFRPVSGKEDAAGGVAFRVKDASNYYLARANGLEDNLRLYVVKDGSRWQLASLTVDPPKLGTWHTLDVSFEGSTLRATLDGVKTVEAKDPTLTIGWCGLWTKSDSVTMFDDWVGTPATPSPVPEKPAVPAPK